MKNIVIAAVALVLAAGALGVIAFGKLGENLVYYWSPSQLLAQGDKAIGPTIRLGGVVAAGSIAWNANKTHLDFKVADGMLPTASFVTVSSNEIPPQMFREGIGVVVEGTYDKSGVFRTNRLMVNHSNKYRPPQEGQSQEEWQKSLLEEEPQATK
ncbi:MAG: cytochrome c maturation protein CcmE [Archangiaceae bacterium]|nr:cytochrome c maturation protein CcmE [Archangiaceae bacterium]